MDALTSSRKDYDSVKMLKVSILNLVELQRYIKVINISRSEIVHIVRSLRVNFRSDRDTLD